MPRFFPFFGFPRFFRNTDFRRRRRRRRRRMTGRRRFRT